MKMTCYKKIRTLERKVVYHLAEAAAAELDRLAVPVGANFNILRANDGHAPLLNVNV